MKSKFWLAIALFLGVTQSWAIDSSDWTCSSSIGCGNSTANGVVVDAPVAGTTGYAWVTTEIAADSSPITFDPAKLPTGVPTTEVKNGTTYTSKPFVVTDANTDVSFLFNYVTSDGGTYSDFAWARLLDSSGSEVALLFTARTDPIESVVPGNGMPPHQATLTPPSVPIIAGAPDWVPLGVNMSGTGMCYDVGCGYSGWVQAMYTISAPGAYQLEIGVVNWSDSSYQSGLAVDGLLVAGQPPSALALSNPGTLPALSAPLYNGTVANPGPSNTVDLVVTGPDGYSETLQSTIQPDSSYSSQGAALQPGIYTVVAVITGTTITQKQTFEVLPAPILPTISLENPGDLTANSTPTYQGVVSNPGTSTTVDLVISGPNGYSETIQTTLNADLSYRTLGASLPAGEYTVVATLTGTNVTQSQPFTLRSIITPGQIAPVPTLKAWAVIALSSLLAMFGLGRSRKHKR